MENNLQEIILPVSVSDESIAQVCVSAVEDELEPYKKQYIVEKRKNVILRGFRKGTAPEYMIAKLFKDEARQSARDNVVYLKYMKLLQDHKLQPLSEPKLESIDENNGHINAKLIVEVLQPIVLGQYLGLEIQKLQQQSLEVGIISALNEIKKLYPKLIEDKKSTAKEGNTVAIDFTIRDITNKIEEQEDFKINLGMNLFFKDFEVQLYGMKAGEIKQFNLNFPESYEREELRGKNVNCFVCMKSIYDVYNYSDDELSAMLNYETKEKMMEAVAKNVDDKNKEKEREFYETQILEYLLGNHNFKIPKKLITDETKRLHAEKPDFSLEEVTLIAERFIRTDLILHSIYERHPDIQFKQEEFNQKISELAAKSNDTIENTIGKLQKANKLQSYINYLNNCKTIDFLIEMSDKKDIIESLISEENNVVKQFEDKE